MNEEDKNRYDQPHSLDLSTKSYREFVEYLFDRPIMLETARREEMFYGSSVLFDAASPEQLIMHMNKMFRELGSLVVPYSNAQIAQGLAELFNPGYLACERWLFVPYIPIEVRLECIRSMYDVFINARIGLSLEEGVADCYYMWWDVIASAFWWSSRPIADFDSLDEQGRKICDTIFETLVKVLNLPNQACHGCALHGLGHLQHPRGRGVIESFIEAHRSELLPEWVRLLEQGIVP